LELKGLLTYLLTYMTDRTKRKEKKTNKENTTARYGVQHNLYLTRIQSYTTLIIVIFIYYCW